MRDVTGADKSRCVKTDVLSLVLCCDSDLIRQRRCGTSVCAHCFKTSCVLLVSMQCLLVSLCLLECRMVNFGNGVMLSQRIEIMLFSATKQCFSMLD